MQRIGPALLLFSLWSAGCTQTAPPKQQAKASEVLVSVATARSITDFEEFTGRTEAKNMVEIKARISGYLDRVYFKDGDTVKEGDLLCEIDPRPYQVELQRTEASLSSAEVKFRRLDADFTRAMTLKMSKSISPEDFEKVRGERGEAESAIAVAKANVAKAKLDLSFTKVVVPTLNNGGKFDSDHPRTGRVGRRMKDPGNLIKADETMLTTIVTLNPMYVYFDVDERTILSMRSLIEQKKIKSIRDMTFSFELANDEGKYPYHGQIDFEDNKLDTGTGTLQLRGVFENTKGFSPGLFVRLRLLVGAPRMAVVIPERALGTDQGQKFLYAVKKESDKEGNIVYKAQYRGGSDLELGALRDGWRVVEKGVEPGEQIIWSGLQRVRKDAPISPKLQEPPNAKAP